MEWQGITVLLAGWVGQVLKGFEKIPTPLAQLIVSITVFACYALAVPPTGDTRAWIMAGIGWCFQTLGASSVFAGLKLAPKTDSI